MAYTTIDDPSAYFNSLIYTGNVTVRALTFDGNSDLAVDWIWLKSRSISGNHHLYDSVRGTQKHLRSNLDSAEGTNGGTDGVTAFSSNGVTIGTNTASNDDGETFVGWGWKAGTSFTNDASGTGIGTIDSAGSVNTDAGFSIISFTGTETNSQSVAHGLGAVPELIISKSRDVADNWMVHHGSFSENDYISLNLTNAKASASSVWSSLPTSTVINIGDNAGVNDDGAMIMYAFRSVQGYSKFGSYTGNGNADGTFVYTGFKPALIIFKNADSGSADWVLYDNKRDGFNSNNIALYPNASAGDDTGNDPDILSNGFKQRATGSDRNANGENIIYMAFAENPFVTSGGVPGLAE